VIGSFQAQYFKFLSLDPNTIFQFFVAADRLYLVRIGSALNQLPQIAHLTKGPIGLSDLAAERLPPEPDVQRLVQSAKGNYELAAAELAACVLKRKHWFGANGTLTFQSRTRGKLFYRFLDAAQRRRAESSLQQMLGERLILE
jgi:hypothetical protein